jgi:hypothetical protein
LISIRVRGSGIKMAGEHQGKKGERSEKVAAEARRNKNRQQARRARRDFKTEAESRQVFWRMWNFAEEYTRGRESVAWHKEVLVSMASEMAKTPIEEKEKQNQVKEKTRRNKAGANFYMILSFRMDPKRRGAGDAVEGVYKAGWPEEVQRKDSNKLAYSGARRCEALREYPGGQPLFMSWAEALRRAGTIEK